MPGSKHLIYWDACVFSDYIGRRPGRIDAITTVLDEVEYSNGTKRLVTSIVSKVEVAFVNDEIHGYRFDAEIEAKIDAMWKDSSYILVVELHEEIALLARSFIREARAMGFGLRANDAIHLASAKWLGAKTFHTYDGGLEKYSPFIECPISQPRADDAQQPRLPLVP